MRISRLSEYKLLADLCMNVAYSFNIQMGDSWFASCGFVSGLLAMQKIWLCSRQTESLENEDSTEESTSPTRNRRGRTTRRLRRRRTHGHLPAITPRTQMSAHEQLKRVASFSFDEKDIGAASDDFVGDSDDSDDLDDNQENGPSNRLKSNGTIYSPSSTMTAAELRRIMSSARIGSILELEQIARQEREGRNHRDPTMFQSAGPNKFF
jgi:hypothetical protein